MALLLAASLARPQAFDVASIKPVPPDTQWGYRFAPGGRTVLTGFRLRDFILLAWRVQDFRVLGTTGWMDSERFNVEAKADGNPGQEESRRMVQSLLADRFHLAMHRENRDLPAWSLVPAKNGPHLSPSRPGICSPYDDSSWPLPAVPNLPVCGFNMRVRKSENAAPVTALEARGVSMSRVATVLGTLLDRQVTDATGIAGSYDFQLEYADDRALPSDTSGPSLFTALQEQLGLKLESRKGPVEVLVIDHAQRPTAN